MARLPTKFDISQQPSGRSGRQIAEYDTSGFGRGLASLGGSISALGEDLKRQQNTVDLARAEAAKAQGFIDVENTFSNDGDYSTFNQRAPKQTGDIVDKSANLIRDPQMRERWKLGAQTDAARVNDSIGDKARSLGKQAETVAFDDALETNRRIYVDPNSSEAARTKARADIEGAIATGEKSGLLTPDQASARRDKFVRNADFNRAKLEAERDPSQFRPGNVVDRIVGAESGGNANAKNPNSSATGAGQFIDSTWLATAKAHRPDLFNGRTAEEVLALRNDKALSKEMTAYLANDNAQFLRNQGIQPTDGDIYLAHFLGPRGAAQVLKADPSASVASIVGQDAVDANPFLKGMSAADVRAWSNKKMGSEAPAYFKNLSPEEQQVVFNQAESRQREMAVEQRGNIETVVQNAPTAIQNTGTYSGAIPTRTEFMDAYGAQDGNERYDKFSAALEVSQQAYNFRTMSADDIQAMVNEAKPTSSGNDAALQAARYDALNSAATTTLAARRADPATYTQQAFPNVARAWSDAANTGNYQAALNATATAQQQLGITDMKLLPKAVADQAVTTFKNPEATDDQRLAAVNSLVFSTPDPTQRQAVFNQLVDAGLPAMTEGAVEAAARGDSGAANRLLQAALTDTGKLPMSGDVKPADIDDQLYSSVWAPGAIGDASYGVAYGDTASLERAQRGGELMKKAVQLRVSQGQDLETAVAGASKDLFGDMKVYDGSYGVNANLPVPSDTDEDTLYSGLNSAKTSFKAALELQRQRVIDGSKADVADGGRAIIDQSTQNRIDDILENGVFVVSGDGVGLRDPYTGQFVPGADGVTPLSIPLQTILDLGTQVSHNTGGAAAGGSLENSGPLVIDIRGGDTNLRGRRDQDVKTYKP
ncbi:hypothetical protein [Rhizobium sp. BK251]|uniref:hypothetical protein n=1 Tax=Rhizobium sp. BK251 TaxID=2512125 RepID=UPI001042F015|nr:hypothetical protein [Rhizobium sp. BK251]TCL70653.1 hypothetical protein EV286_107531 [Rhizobium sp. BK251]